MFAGDETVVALRVLGDVAFGDFVGFRWLVGLTIGWMIGWGASLQSE